MDLGSRLDEFEMGFGEILAIVSTFFWTMHITYTDIATGYVDSLSMMCVQLGQTYPLYPSLSLSERASDKPFIGFVTFLSAFAAILFEPQEWFFDHIER
jgi:hypothetical protein